MVTALLVGGAVLVNVARQYGVNGLLLGTAVAALADAHAPMASLLAIFEAGRLPLHELTMGLLVAITVNAGTRSMVAAVSGGGRFGLGVSAALALNVASAWAWVWWVKA